MSKCGLGFSAVTRGFGLARDLFSHKTLQKVLGIQHNIVNTVWTFLIWLYLLLQDIFLKTLWCGQDQISKFKVNAVKFRWTEGNMHIYIHYMWRNWSFKRKRQVESESQKWLSNYCIGVEFENVLVQQQMRRIIDSFMNSIRFCRFCTVLFSTWAMIFQKQQSSAEWSYWLYYSNICVYKELVKEWMIIETCSSTDCCNLAGKVIARHWNKTFWPHSHWVPRHCVRASHLADTNVNTSFCYCPSQIWAQIWGPDLILRHQIPHWHQSAHNLCECPGILPMILCSHCQHGRRVELVKVDWCR